VQPIPGI